MPDFGINLRLLCGVILLHQALTIRAWSGGSGLNTVVIINQHSSNSCEVGNYFCERRQVPPENVLRVYWTGDNISWTSNQFQTVLLDPLLAMLNQRQLTNQVDYVVLSMDFPYRTLNGLVANSTTAALFYGLKVDYGPDWPAITNSYAASEQIFSQARPASAKGYSFLTSMITGSSVVQAKQLIDQGVASDATFPGRPVLLAKSSDPTRNIRFKAFDNTVFNTRLRLNYWVQRTNLDSLVGQTNLLGVETGLAEFSVSSNAFVPGAMADSLTSFGGQIFELPTQSTLLSFVSAGAVGSYGTVTEPSASAVRFPDPQNYFYQSRGFTMAECYYQSLQQPYMGLVVGEPLAAPFSRAASGSWQGVSSNVVLNATAPLSLQFSAVDARHPLQQVDLFVDGKLFQTLTNLAPRAGNVLTVSLNGYPVSYTVPSNATVGTVASGLAAALNSMPLTNSPKISAFCSGDRIQLQGTATNGQWDPFYFLTAPATNGVTPFYRLVFLPGPGPFQIKVLGRDATGAFSVHADAPANLPCVIEASSDLVHWTPVFSSAIGGALDYVDVSARNYSRRFYRLAASVTEGRVYLPDPGLAQITPLGRTSSGTFGMQMNAPAGFPCVVEASTNLADWAPIYTNWAGGPWQFFDPPSTKFSRRFYRLAGTASAPPPKLSLPWGSGDGAFRLHVESGSVAPYSIEASSNLLNWAPILTNLAGGAMDWVEAQTAGFPRRFYRALLLPPPTPAVQLNLAQLAGTAPLIRVDGTTRSYRIEVSTNLSQWTSVLSNLTPGGIQVTATSSTGGAAALSTFVAASRDTFLDSLANGYQSFRVDGSVDVGAWLRFIITKTNGEQAVVCVTNQSPTATPLDLTTQLCDAVNASATLQGRDGVSAEDVIANFFGAVTFNLRARGAGMDASGLQALLAGSPSLSTIPNVATALRQNLADLQPRNHLYISAGATNLAVTFPLDTTSLADGFHELTAVAYEGSHVRTQTRISLPVRVQNTSLSASLNLLDPGDTAPVQSAFHFQVNASTNVIDNIALYSTGGVLKTVTNQVPAVFVVNGSYMGIGLHPFYAVVQTAGGTKYRTDTKWLRFVGGP